MESVMKKAAAAGIICRTIDVDCAFHSPVVAGAEKEYKEALDRVAFRSPQIPVWANTTAEPYPEDHRVIRTILSDHLLMPLRFDRQIGNMHASGVRIFIETGPGRVLSGLVESILGNRVATIQTESKSGDGISTLLRALGQYLSLGKEFDIEKLFTGRGVVRLELDNPGQYRPSATGWIINGSSVYPASGNKIAE
jgi:acyl transferase domain-containing protein